MHGDQSPAAPFRPADLRPLVCIHASHHTYEVLPELGAYVLSVSPRLRACSADSAVCCGLADRVWQGTGLVALPRCGTAPVMVRSAVAGDPTCHLILVVTAAYDGPAPEEWWSLRLNTLTSVAPASLAASDPPSYAQPLIGCALHADCAEPVAAGQCYASGAALSCYPPVVRVSLTSAYVQSTSLAVQGTYVRASAGGHPLRIPASSRLAWPPAVLASPRALGDALDAWLVAWRLGLEQLRRGSDVRAPPDAVVAALYVADPYAGVIPAGVEERARGTDWSLASFSDAIRLLDAGGAAFPPLRRCMQLAQPVGPNELRGRSVVWSEPDEGDILARVRQGCDVIVHYSQLRVAYDLIMPGMRGLEGESAAVPHYHVFPADAPELAGSAHGSAVRWYSVCDVADHFAAGALAVYSTSEHTLAEVCADQALILLRSVATWGAVGAPSALRAFGAAMAAQLYTAPVLIDGVAWCSRLRLLPQGAALEPASDEARLLGRSGLGLVPAEELVRGRLALVVRHPIMRAPADYVLSARSVLGPPAIVDGHAIAGGVHGRLRVHAHHAILTPQTPILHVSPEVRVRLAGLIAHPLAVRETVVRVLPLLPNVRDFVLGAHGAGGLRVVVLPLALDVPDRTYFSGFAAVDGVNPVYPGSLLELQVAISYLDGDAGGEGTLLVCGRRLADHDAVQLAQALRCVAIGSALLFLMREGASAPYDVGLLGDAGDATSESYVIRVPGRPLRNRYAAPQPPVALFDLNALVASCVASDAALAPGYREAAELAHELLDACEAATAFGMATTDGELRGNLLDLGLPVLAAVRGTVAAFPVQRDYVQMAVTHAGEASLWYMTWVGDLQLGAGAAMASLPSVRLLPTLRLAASAVRDEAPGAARLSTLPYGLLALVPAIEDGHAGLADAVTGRTQHAVWLRAIRRHGGRPWLARTERMVLATVAGLVDARAGLLAGEPGVLYTPQPLSLRDASPVGIDVPQVSRPTGRAGSVLWLDPDAPAERGRRGWRYYDVALGAGLYPSCKPLEVRRSTGHVMLGRHQVCLTTVPTHSTLLYLAGLAAGAADLGAVLRGACALGAVELDNPVVLLAVGGSSLSLPSSLGLRAGASFPADIRSIAAGVPVVFTFVEVGSPPAAWARTFADLAPHHVVVYVYDDDVTSPAEMFGDELSRTAPGLFLISVRMRSAEMAAEPPSFSPAALAATQRGVSQLALGDYHDRQVAPADLVAATCKQLASSLRFCGSSVGALLPEGALRDAFLTAHRSVWYGDPSTVGIPADAFACLRSDPSSSDLHPLVRSALSHVSRAIVSAVPWSHSWLEWAQLSALAPFPGGSVVQFLLVGDEPRYSDETATGVVPVPQANLWYVCARDPGPVAGFVPHVAAAMDAAHARAVLAVVVCTAHVSPALHAAIADALGGLTTEADERGAVSTVGVVLSGDMAVLPCALWGTPHLNAGTVVSSMPAPLCSVVLGAPAVVQVPVPRGAAAPERLVGLAALAISCLTSQTDVPGRNALLLALADCMDSGVLLERAAACLDGPTRRLTLLSSIDTLRQWAGTVANPRAAPTDFVPMDWRPSGRGAFAALPSVSEAGGALLRRCVVTTGAQQARARAARSGHVLDPALDDDAEMAALTVGLRRMLGTPGRSGATPSSGRGSPWAAPAGTPPGSPRPGSPEYNPVPPDVPERVLTPDDFVTPPSSPHRSPLAERRHWCADV